MQTSDFDYVLPPELIAQAPADRRDQSRMMVVSRDGDTPPAHSGIADLPDFLRPGDLLVVNDTRVIPARLRGQWRDTGGAAELLLIEPVAGSHWRSLCRSGRTPRNGLEMVFGQGGLTARIISGRDNEGAITVDLRGRRPLAELLPEYGEIPLPPYIRRPADERDSSRYQTIYAARPGAVAAPTAGLHFTGEVLAALARKGVGRAALTLHVGPGTFRPVKADRIEDHVMESERYVIGDETALALRQCRREGGRIVAVGSTCVRALETMARENNGEAVAGSGRSSLFIRPPFRFQMVDVMLTNFHLPRSSLLMMVAAFAGREKVMAAYREATERGYRFYSYGDCMLLR